MVQAKVIFLVGVLAIFLATVSVEGAPEGLLGGLVEVGNSHQKKTELLGVNDHNPVR